MNKPRFRNRRNKNEFNSGFQPSEQGPDVDTPPLRDGAEIIRAFSPRKPRRGGELLNC